MRRAVFVLILVLLLTGLLPLTFKIQPVRGEWTGTIYIRADGSIDPPDAPIIVFNNTNYLLTDNILSYEDGIVVERSNIVIDGNGSSIQGILALNSKGVYLSNVQGVTIKNLNIQKFYYGIYLNYSSSNTIYGIIVANNQYGIYLLSSSYNNVSENNIIANGEHGVYVEDSSNNSISKNHIASNKGDGVHLWENSLYNILSENNVTANKGHGTYLGHSWLVAHTYNIISQNYIALNNQTGIVLYHPSDNIISRNTVTANQEQGIYLSFFSSNNEVSENNVTANKGHGIHVFWNSNSNNITENDIKSNGGDGIRVELSSSGNNITKNNVTLNKGHGICLGGWGGGGSNNIVYSNNITANDGNGLLLESCSNSVVSGNNVVSNKAYGIRLSSSSQIAIYHNNFIDNIASCDSLNAWDDGYPSGGNYWSDFEGVDLYKGPYQNQNGSDGIGDTFYFIDGQYMDRYPLMAPFNTFEAGTWDGKTFYVDIVSNSTLSDFYFGYGCIKFNVTGPDNSMGFSRVTIPRDLLAPEMGWKVTVGDEEVNYTLISSNENTYLYFTYMHSAKTVLIQALISYELIITATEGGTTNPTPGTYTYVSGTIVQVGAIPYVNYRFDYWMLDGEVKTENPITIIMDANHTLQAFFIDSRAPVTTDDYDDLWHNTDFTITLMAIDYESGVAETYYRINNGPIKAVSVDGHPLITTEGANNTLEYWSVDNAGNEELPHKILTGIKLDKTKPSSSISFDGTVGDNNWFISNVTVTLTADDVLSGVDLIFYSFDNVKWEKYVEPFTISNEGVVTVYFKSVDKAGNLESVKMETIKIDKTPPTGSIAINNNAPYTNSTLVTLSLTAIDATSGISKVRFSNDGIWDTEPWEDCTPTKAWIIPEGDGVKTVYVQFMDNAGLISTTYSDIIILDTTPPLIVAVNRQPDGDVEPSQTVKIFVNVTDSLSGVGNLILSYNINNSSTWTYITMTLNVTSGLYEGIILGQQADTLVKYKIIAYDNAGNHVVEDNDGQYYVYTVVPEFPSLIILLALMAFLAYFLNVAKKKLGRGKI